MNIKVVTTFSLLATVSGAIMLGVAGVTELDFGLAALAGGAMIVSAVLGHVFVCKSVHGAVSKIVTYADDLVEDGAATPPDLAPPFDQMARVMARAMETASERVSARSAEARRIRLAAQSLRHQHDVTVSLLESLSDGVVLFDPAGLPTLMNRAAMRYMEVDAQTDLGSDLSAVRSPALRQAMVQALNGGSDARIARDIDCSDQTRRRVLRVQFLDVRTRPEGADDDVGLAVLIRDVTRERELNRMKSDFASSVSHELKTPLSSMRAFLEMLLDGDIEGEEERRVHMQMVLDETERLTQLIQNLLNLSRLESGVTRMERAAVSLDEVLSHLRQIVTPLAEARRQTILFEVSDFVPGVMGDRRLLEQALMNLISNAIKYTPEGGSITVRAALAGSMVEVAVRDTGVGIPPAALELVFDKFTRIENHAGLKATGTGLGLPLAKFVAEAHGGKVTVTSEEGKGSEFRLLLPARRAHESTESRLVGLEGIST